MYDILYELIYVWPKNQIRNLLYGAKGVNERERERERETEKCHRLWHREKTIKGI